MLFRSQWENTLLLPGCAGMPENIGLAGAYSGIVEGKLLVLGGANFPDKYPWEGGIKTWWATLYSYDLDTEEWTVYDDFLDRPLAYGVSISLPEGLLCIGGCDHARCSDKVFLIKKEIDSFVIDSVSYPSLPVPLANAAGAICDNCIYIAGGAEGTGGCGVEGVGETGSVFVGEGALCCSIPKFPCWGD